MTTRGSVLQRKCACGTHTVAGGECDSCGKKRLQRTGSNRSDPPEVPAVVHDVLNSPGRPLDPATRAFMEPRFGHDFSRVRVHTDARAAESARAVNALAYTVGSNVVFDTGQYAPQEAAGRRLLAHELTHTIQQGPRGSLFPATLALTSPSDAAERHAEAAASAVMRGRPFALATGGPPRLARQAAQSEAAPRLLQKGPDNGPEVKLVPDIRTGNVRVLVDGVPVYEIHLPNAQGGIKMESNWSSASKKFELEVTVTQGASVTNLPGINELGKRFPYVNLVVNTTSPVNGLPVLAPKDEFEKTIYIRPTDPDLKHGYIPVEDVEDDITPEFTPSPPLTPAPEASQKVETKKAEEEGGLWDSIGEWIHGGLDIIGFVPVFGEIADGINAIIYLVEGRYAEAAISGIAMIPIWGDIGKIGKWTVKGTKELAEQGAKQGAKQLAKEGAKELAEKGAKEVTEEAAGKGSKELAKAGTKGALKEGAETALERAARYAEEGTIVTYKKGKKLTKGLKKQYEAHHILEARHLRRWGRDALEAPAVILSREAHKNITGELLKALPKGIPHSKEAVWNAYQKVYAKFPEYLEAIKPYFKDVIEP